MSRASNPPKAIAAPASVQAGERQRTAPTVAEAIQQARPFRSAGQEALIALRLTAEVTGWDLQDLLAEHDLTHQQFNVLRILRGAGDPGLATLDIADRMIERTPGVTRLLDRMEAKGLVARQRSAEDRRQVRCTITKMGRAALAKLDRPLEKLHARVVAPLTAAETQTLIALLDKVRTGRA